MSYQVMAWSTPRRSGHLVVTLSSWVVLGAVVGALSCSRPSRTDQTRATGSASAQASASTAPARPAPPPARPSAAAPKEVEEPPEQRDAATDAGASGPYRTGELQDVGPAGPASATRVGVVMVTRNNQVLVAKPRNGTPRPGHTRTARLVPVKADPEAFFPYAAGPAVIGSHAYWIADGKLLRRELGADKPPEVLAEDGHTGARVAAAPPPETGKTAPATVAYIASGHDSPVAKLWVEGKGTELLSPDGAAANSVALTRAGSMVVSVALEGRSGMSPVHARPIRITDAGTTLGEDVVVWVAGGSQRLTEVSAIQAQDDLIWGFLPIERDISHFGLARIHLELPLQMNATISWRTYPNGLDPAPVTCAKICGQPAVAYVRPADNTPHAPQELHLAPVLEDGLGTSEVLSRSSAFVNVSLASWPGGGLVAYVADRRTWALPLECASK
jgi:hypothetical protein